MDIPRKQQRRLKELLCHPVPKIYLDLMRRFPKKLKTALDEADAEAANHPLFGDFDFAVAQNGEVREEDIWTEDGPWPKDHLLIGGELGGDKFSLLVSSRPPSVWRLNHETGCFEPLAKSLRAYTSRVRRWLSGDDEALSPKAPTGSRQQPDAEPVAAAYEAAGAYYKAGNAYEEAGQLQAALRCFETGIALDPHDRRLWRRKRNLLDLSSLALVEPKPHLERYRCEPPLFATIEKLHEELLRASEQVMRLDAEDARHRIEHASYLGRVGRTSEALPLLRGCCDEEPVARLTIAKLLESSGDPSAALEEIRCFLRDKKESDLDGYTDEIRVLRKLGLAAELEASIGRYRDHLLGKIEQYPEEPDYYRDELAKLDGN